MRSKWSIDDECALVDFMSTNNGPLNALKLAAKLMDRSYDSVSYRWYKIILPELKSLE